MGRSSGRGCDALGADLFLGRQIDGVVDDSIAFPKSEPFIGGNGGHHGAFEAFGIAGDEVVGAGFLRGKRDEAILVIIPLKPCGGGKIVGGERYGGDNLVGFQQGLLDALRAYLALKHVERVFGRLRRHPQRSIAEEACGYDALGIGEERFLSAEVVDQHIGVKQEIHSRPIDDRG